MAGDTHVELMVSQEVSAKDRAIDSGQGELPVEPVGPAGRRGEGEREGSLDGGGEQEKAGGSGEGEEEVKGRQEGDLLLHRETAVCGACLR